MSTELRKLREKNQSYIKKVPDENVREALERLTSKIGQFAKENLSELPEASDKELGSHWEELTPHARKILESCSLRNFLFESYIWEWLHRNIFQLHSDVWAGNMGKGMSKLLERVKSELPPSLQQILQLTRQNRRNRKCRS